MTPVLVAVQGEVRDDTAHARGALRTARCARELQRRASSRRAEMPHASGHWRQRSRGKPPRATFADAPAHARHVGLRCRRPTRTPSRGASAAPSCTWSRARDTSGEQPCARRGHIPRAVLDCYYSLTAYLSFVRWAHYPLELAKVIARFLEAPPPTHVSPAGRILGINLPHSANCGEFTRTRRAERPNGGAPFMQ